MVITALDTYQLVSQLRSGGFTDEQAETLTGVLRNTQDIGRSNLAAQGSTYCVIAAMKADFAKFKADIFTAMFWQTFVIVGAIVALLKK